MITFILNDKGIKIEGHAPREEGKTENLTCAAVSALAQTILDSLEEIAGQDIQRIAQESGLIEATWSELNPGAVILLRALALGVENIAYSNPGTINIVTAPNGV